jgi:hypothetical protein
MRDDDEDWQSSSDDDSYDADDDYDDMPDEPTVECPYCGFEMLEVCVQCPKCGQYPSKEDSLQRSQPMWVVLTAVLTILAIVFWIFIL